MVVYRATHCHGNVVLTKLGKYAVVSFQVAFGYSWLTAISSIMLCTRSMCDVFTRQWLHIYIIMRLNLFPIGVGRQWTACCYEPGRSFMFYRHPTNNSCMLVGLFDFSSIPYITNLVDISTTWSSSTEQRRKESIPRNVSELKQAGT